MVGEKKEKKKILQTNLQSKTKCSITANVEAFVSGGHRCNLILTASCPPACTNAVLAAV
jgi:hypothetical protein